MTSILKSLNIHRIGAILVLPLFMASTGLSLCQAQTTTDTTTTTTGSLAISQEPESVEVQAPAEAAFAVAATGTDLKYQWQRDGQNIEGATSEIFTLATTSMADNGAVFKVIVTDASGQTVTSAQAVLTVTEAAAKPVINSFASDLPSIAAGGSATLTWDVTDATSLSIDPIGVVTGTSVQVQPTATTTYVLTAQNANGSVTSTPVIVSLENQSGPTAPVITSFAASAPSINLGETCTLTWAVSGATSLVIDNNVGPVTGTETTVKPTGNTTYKLTATNAYGSVSTTATVEVAAADNSKLPVITSFTPSSSSISYGGSVMLSWLVSNVTEMSIDNGIGKVVGNYITVRPTATTTYTLTATNAFGSTTATAMLNVGSMELPVIDKFAVNTWAIRAGQTTNLVWNIKNAKAVSIDNGIGVVTGTSTVAIKPITTTTYTITATNDAGSVTAAVTVLANEGSCTQYKHYKHYWHYKYWLKAKKYKKNTPVKVVKPVQPKPYKVVKPYYKPYYKPYKNPYYNFYYNYYTYNRRYYYSY